MGYNKNNSKGMPKHGHHMVNSWEEEDVKRGKKQMAEGHKGHAEALFDDAHGSYNWKGGNQGSEPFHMQGSFMSKHAGNSYFHKQNLLDDMPIDDHAGGPLKQTEGEGRVLSHYPDRKNKLGQTQAGVYNQAASKADKAYDNYKSGSGTWNDYVKAYDNVTRIHDSIDTANVKMDKHVKSLEESLKKMRKGDYPGSL